MHGTSHGTSLCYKPTGLARCSPSRPRPQPRAHRSQTPPPPKIGSTAYPRHIQKPSQLARGSPIPFLDHGIPPRAYPVLNQGNQRGACTHECMSACTHGFARGWRNMLTAHPHGRSPYISLARAIYIYICTADPTAYHGSRCLVARQRVLARGHIFYFRKRR